LPHGRWLDGAGLAAIVPSDPTMLTGELGEVKPTGRAFLEV